MLNWILVLFLLWSQILVSFAADQPRLFADAELKIDTARYRLSNMPERFRNQNTFLFFYRSESEMALLMFEPDTNITISDIFVKGSPGVSVLATQKVAVSNLIRVHLRFDDITAGNFFHAQIKVLTTDGHTLHDEIFFQPVVKMHYSLTQIPEEVFVGEETVTEINTNLPQNVQLTHQWVFRDNFQYRIIRHDHRILLHLIPLTAGSRTFTIQIDQLKPDLDLTGTLNYSREFETPVFNVRTSRLAFVSFDLNEITLSDVNRRDGIEIQIDNHRLLQLNRTYRIENQEEAGGVLIAEFFTRSRLANNRVLGIIRPYNYHQAGEGSLFIKEGDKPLFITHLSVIPQTNIRSVRLLRDGRNWTEQLNVHPGETVVVRLEGESLNRARIRFDIPLQQSVDTLVWQEKEAEFQVHVPLHNPKTRIDILVNGKPSGFLLNMIEYQRPRQFDFITINYGNGPKTINEIKGPIFYESTIRDIVISFDPNKIDGDMRLYGKQYIDLDVRILGSRGELIENHSIERMAICPGENSPRFTFYSRNDCRMAEISLNQILNRKTFDWDMWTRAIITVSHTSDRYQSGHHRKIIDLVLQRPFRFDVDVSFPAGLLILRPGEDQIGNLSGISMAMMAQFSFFYREQIARQKPYKLGAGFLALNAFNFAENNINRDMGIVLIGSVFPTRRDARMIFPLHVGGGYFLNQRRLFFLLGPGIRVNF